MRLPFFSVSVCKLVVMHIVTLGMYQFFWVYRHWIAVRNFKQIYISPAARTVVGPIFTFSLFKRIFDASHFAPIASLGLTAFLGTALLATSVAGCLPPPYSVIALFAVLPTIPVQILANRANRFVDPLHTVNAKLSGLNWLAVVIGGGLILLAIGGALLSTSSPPPTP